MTKRKPTPAEMYPKRLEALLVAVWPAAMAGDTRAVECARRVLAQQGKYLGIDAEVGPTPPISDNALVTDELAAFRKRYTAVP